MLHPTNAVYISQDDPFYGPLLEEVASNLRDRSVIPFLGAGISKPPPSCLPLAGTLSEPLREALWTSIGESTQSRCPKTDVDGAYRIVFEETRLERLLDVLHQTHGDSVMDYLRVLDTKAWNWNHGFLAALAKASLLPTCITLNFDLLIEEALLAYGGAAITECPLQEERFKVGGGNPCTHIIKPHGSLSPLAYSANRFDLLSATLSQVGNHPSPKNVRLLQQSFSAHSRVLVAGYSNNDWDIFPILKKLASSIDRIYWVDFCGDHDVRNRSYAISEDFESVLSWLRDNEVRCSLLAGDPLLLLRDLVDRTSTEAKIEPPIAVRHLDPDSSLFLSHSNDSFASLRTAVALSILVQNRGNFNDWLLRELIQHPRIDQFPDLLAKVHRVMAHTNHTRGKIYAALHNMKKVVALKNTMLQQDSKLIADDLLWMGYEYLCLAKRPTLRNPVPFLFPRKSVQNGCNLLRRACRLARTCDSNEKKRIQALSRFYLADYRHNRSQIWFVLKGFGLRRIRPMIRRVIQTYDAAASIDPDRMDWEYYWLRRLEAQILSGDHDYGPSEIDSKIDEIHTSYRILQNTVQEGNPFLYKALLRWSEGRLSEARLLLDDAEAVWTTPGKVSSSGLGRVALYRWGFSIGGFWRTVWRLLVNR